MNVNTVTSFVKENINTIKIGVFGLISACLIYITFNNINYKNNIKTEISSELETQPDIEFDEKPVEFTKNIDVINNRVKEKTRYYKKRKIVSHKKRKKRSYKKRVFRKYLRIQQKINKKKYVKKLRAYAKKIRRPKKKHKHKKYCSKKCIFQTKRNIQQAKKIRARKKRTRIFNWKKDAFIDF